MYKITLKKDKFFIFLQKRMPAMKKNMSVTLVLILSFQMYVLPMELSSDDSPPGVGKYLRNNQDEDEVEFNEFMPVLSASQAVLRLFEGAEMGVDEKIDVVLNEGFSFCGLLF